jgi:hypothetical protein
MARTPTAPARTRPPLGARAGTLAVRRGAAPLGAAAAGAAQPPPPPPAAAAPGASHPYLSLQLLGPDLFTLMGRGAFDASPAGRARLAAVGAGVLRVRWGAARPAAGGLGCCSGKPGNWAAANCSPRPLRPKHSTRSAVAHEPMHAAALQRPVGGFRH